MAEGAATVVALADGNASVHFSAGGSVIGAGAESAVRDAALQFCNVATRFVGESQPTSERSIPRAGRVRFYFMTTSGPRLSEAEEAAVARGTDPLSPPCQAGNDLLTRWRVLSGG